VLVSYNLEFYRHVRQANGHSRFPLSTGGRKGAAVAAVSSRIGIVLAEGAAKVPYQAGR